MCTDVKGKFKIFEKDLRHGYWDGFGLCLLAHIFLYDLFAPQTHLQCSFTVRIPEN